MNSHHNRHKVLIANRGEIAVRIVRACRDADIATVAVYADADSNALHVRMADEAWALPGVTPRETYLNSDALLAVARRCGATMVHPGYGFLSERADFARAVQQAGLIWIGPHPHTIEQLGDKVQARKIALAAGAPLVQGTADPVASAAEVLDFARQFGLPVAIKAAFGGGGRGLKVARTLDAIPGLYHSAVREAEAAFGRGECYVEQFLDSPRHIEAQIMADSHGHVVVVGTRDCSLQRRNQKLVEEAPAPFISPQQREAIHEAAVNICRQADYLGAGTVEFLLSNDGRLSFLEVNTRLQVEHPVTEETSGVDLVAEQLRVAQGLPLSFTATPPVRGHAFEFRINAEDAGRGFLPTPGQITRFVAPSGPGVRLDSGVAEGDAVIGQFDSLMAKLIVTGATREQAIERARRALAEFTIDGVASVLPFHRAVMAEADFTVDFQVHTRWIETCFAGRVTLAPRQLPAPTPAVTRSWIELDGRRVTLGFPAGLLASGTVATQAVTGEITDVPGAVLAPVTGVLHCWLVEENAVVQAGDVLAVMEAMKMEVPVLAEQGGVLRQQATAGSPLAAGTPLAMINAA
ncbi:ATP-grasp domain-containing protein [Shimwellia pseudoproteus]|uniref:acetyl/propionyl/methylcrotonyl-CoA carboxylase subunit alpha n=1 Tax=Shimwellia pseudoproteus TaxID=570012 RepID=UPI0018EB45DC|nr:biotin carboxylase N-terminal domain-containing protein [Shimwellia pseudoproteus]MBJ3814624.1 ATP-grasp domain-containing protein [Shimwellia pseudoproteus]